MVKDPVCGMELDKKDAVKVKHKGKTYYVCGSNCQHEFESNPERYVCAKCGKECDLETTNHKIKHEGKVYCFCSAEHKKKFQLENFGEVLY